MTVTRHFLGWDAPALPRAADFLRERFKDQNFDGVLIALPGARAGRRLEELLIDCCGKAWIPPRIGTIGGITDALVRFTNARASGLARDLAWIESLRAAPPAELDTITRRRPEDTDFAGWSALTEQLRALHQELAAERRRFAEVAECSVLPTTERARWRALAAVQADYLARIARCGLCDPHDERVRALEENRPVRATRALVLVGVSSVNGLQEELLRRADAQGIEVIALVVAPQAEEAGFDDFGLLRAENWKDRAAPLDDARWRVADRPSDQAEEATAFLEAACAGELDGRATVAVLQDEVAPFLARRLAEKDSDLRPPVGRTLTESAPGRLLDAVRAWLEGRAPRAYAALLRHPDFVAMLKPERDLVTACDKWMLESLPAITDEHAPHLQAVVHALGAMADETPRAISTWPPSCAALLQAVFGRDDAAEHLETREHRETREARHRFAAALDEVGALPTLLAGERIGAADFLRLLLRAAAREPLAPDPTRRGLEQLGWLDLPLDEAPALCVTGFQLGAAPEAVHGHAFLPESLRIALGLPSNDDRRARDVLALHVLTHAREQLLFISGQRGTAGDPWLPSPLVFQGADAPARVRAFFRAPEPRATASGGTTTPWTPPLPPAPKPMVVDSFSASALNLYRKSPRLYWLQRVLGLESVEAEPHELDALRFGSFAHAVLERFHQDEGSARMHDAHVIHGAIGKLLRDEAVRRFGVRPLATVRLQLAQLEGRLRGWAEAEAASRAAGWKTIAVELSVEKQDPVRVEIGGISFGLHGRLDRVDRRVHEGRVEIRVLDYKSGDQPTLPGKAYAERSQRWHDLQLPLYRRIAQAKFADAALIRTGWFNLPRAVEKTGIAEAEWSGDELGLADAAMFEAVRGIRAGEFEEIGSVDRRQLAPALLALLGEAPALDGDDDAEKVEEAS